MQQTEEQIANAKPIAYNKDKVLYVYNGKVDDDKFSWTNLETGNTGILNQHQSQKLLKVPIELNALVLKHQNLIPFLKAFNGSVLVENLETKERKQYKV